MSLVVPSTSNSDGYGEHSWALVAELAWLNSELTKQRSDVSVKEVALELIEDYPVLVDLVIVLGADGILYKYRVPVAQSRVDQNPGVRQHHENCVTRHQPQRDGLSAGNQNAQSIRPTRECSVVFDWGESGTLDVFARVHLNKENSVEKKFREYDRQAFVDAYRLNRLEHALFEQIVLFFGDGARVAFEEAQPPMVSSMAGHHVEPMRHCIHH